MRMWLLLAGPAVRARPRAAGLPDETWTESSISYLTIRFRATPAADSERDHGLVAGAARAW